MIMPYHERHYKNGNRIEPRPLDFALDGEIFPCRLRRSKAVRESPTAPRPTNAISCRSKWVLAKRLDRLLRSPLRLDSHDSFPTADYCAHADYIEEEQWNDGFTWFPIAGEERDVFIGNLLNYATRCSLTLRT